MLLEYIHRNILLHLLKHSIAVMAALPLLNFCGGYKTHIKINREEGVIEVIFHNANLVLQKTAKHNKFFIHDYL